jgi:uncharacterized membrane protein YdjX (TVP38/TMEM64 family)
MRCAANPLQVIRDFGKHVLGSYRKLRPAGKAFVWCTIVFYIAFSAFFIIVTPARIFQSLYQLAHRLSLLRFGWLALAAVTALTCFPPFVGHTTVVTLCGFAYGMKGFAIAAPASSIGSTIVFWTFRRFCTTRLRHWSATNRNWQALESVIRAKGLPLIILTRMSPFPTWIWSNILFSSIEAVALWQFVIATLFVYPKFLLHVFIGSRAAALADGKQRNDMATQTKILNWILIIVGMLAATTSSWLIYRLMKRQIRQIEDLPEETNRRAANTIDDLEEGAPLLRDFSTESVDNERSIQANGGSP